MPGDVEYMKGEDGLEFSFSHTVKNSFRNTDYLFLAYIYPYTFLDHLYSINEVQMKCEKLPEVVFFEKK